MLHKIYLHCRQLVETLIGEKDLLQRLVMVASAPWFFDGLDMLRLCNGQAQSIWHSKKTNHFWVIIGRVLFWEQEAFLSDPNLLENRPVLVKAGKSIFKFSKGLLHNDIMPGNITKF